MFEIQLRSYLKFAKVYFMLKMKAKKAVLKKTAFIITMKNNG